MKRACAFFSRAIVMPGGKWRLAQTLRGHRDVVTCVATDGKGRVVSGGQDCVVRMWAGAGGSGLQGYLTSSVCVSAMSGHNNWVTCVAFAEGDKVVISGGEDATVMLWSADRGREGQPLRKFEGRDSCRGASLSTLLLTLEHACHFHGVVVHSEAQSSPRPCTDTSAAALARSCCSTTPLRD